MRKFLPMFRKKTVLNRILLISFAFAVIMMCFLMFNNAFIRNRISAEVTAHNMKYLEFVKSNAEKLLVEMRKTLISCNTQNDFIIISNQSGPNDVFYETSEDVRQAAFYISYSMEYVQDVFFAFSNTDKTVSSAGVTDTDAFIESINKRYGAAFSPESIDWKLGGERLSVYPKCSIYSRCILNGCCAFVLIDTSQYTEFLNKSMQNLQSSLIISDPEGQVFASTPEFNPGTAARILRYAVGMSRQAIELDGESYVAHNLPSRTLGLNFTILYNSRDLEDRLSSVNDYTFYVLLFFGIVNMLFILFNYTVYTPLSRTLASLNSANTSMKDELYRQKEFVESNSLLKLLTHPELSTEHAALGDLADTYRSYAVLAIVIESGSTGRASADGMRVFEVMMVAGHVCRSIPLSARHGVYVVSMVEHDYDETVSKISGCLQAMSAEEGLFCLCGVSALHDDITALSQAYEESMHALLNRPVCLESACAVRRFGEPDAETGEKPYISIAEEQELMGCIQYGNLPGLDQFFNRKLRRKLSALTYTQARELCRYLMGLMNILMAAKEADFASLEAGDPPDVDNSYNPRYLLDRIHNCFTRLASRTPQREQELYRAISEYIHDHYMEDLSLDSIAEKFNLSPSYLSFYFKKQSGTNLFTYLSQVRVNAAISLMAGHPDMPIMEIAEQVGIFSITTFIRVFKKISGDTPGDYRRKLTDRQKNCRSGNEER